MHVCVCSFVVERVRRSRRETSIEFGLAFFLSPSRSRERKNLGDVY